MNEKKTAPRHYTGLTPKRGFARQFKALDAEIKDMNRDLDHFIIQDVASFSCGNITHTADATRAEIAKKLEEIKQFAMTDEELHIAEMKRQFKELHKDPNYSDLGAISDAIRNFRRPKTAAIPYGYVRKMLDICGGRVIGFAFNKDELPEEEIAGTTEDIEVFTHESDLGL